MNPVELVVVKFLYGLGLRPCWVELYTPDHMHIV